MKLIHIYGQQFFHDDAFIIGTREGLTALRDAINEALEKGRAVTEVFVNDGEGYDICIALNDSNCLSPFWNKLAVPYADEMASEKREDALQPRSIWRELSGE
jgi:hypothetical protein